MHAATAGNTGGTESPLSAPNPPLGSPRDSPKTGAPDNIFRVKSVAASRRYSGTDAQQRESGMPPDSASGEIMQLSSPPPKQSAQPGLKGPSRLNVPRSSTVDSLLKDDRSDDGAPEDEFFFSLWRSGHDVTYKHEAVLADLKQLVISGDFIIILIILFSGIASALFIR